MRLITERDNRLIEQIKQKLIIWNLELQIEIGRSFTDEQSETLDYAMSIGGRTAFEFSGVYTNVNGHRRIRIHTSFFDLDTAEPFWFDDLMRAVEGGSDWSQSLPEGWGVNMAIAFFRDLIEREGFTMRHRELDNRGNPPVEEHVLSIRQMFFDKVKTSLAALLDMEIGSFDIRSEVDLIGMADGTDPVFLWNMIIEMRREIVNDTSLNGGERNRLTEELEDIRHFIISTRQQAIETLRQQALETRRRTNPASMSMMESQVVRHEHDERMRATNGAPAASSGSAALMEASRRGHTDIVQALLRAEANPNDQVDGSSVTTSSSVSLRAPERDAISTPLGVRVGLVRHQAAPVASSSTARMTASQVQHMRNAPLGARPTSNQSLTSMLMTHGVLVTVAQRVQSPVPQRGQSPVAVGAQLAPTASQYSGMSSMQRALAERSRIMNTPAVRPSTPTSPQRSQSPVADASPVGSVQRVLAEGGNVRMTYAQRVDATRALQRGQPVVRSSTPTSPQRSRSPSARSVAASSYSDRSVAARLVEAAQGRPDLLRNVENSLVASLQASRRQPDRIWFQEAPPSTDRSAAIAPFDDDEARFDSARAGEESQSVARRQTQAGVVGIPTEAEEEAFRARVNQFSDMTISALTANAQHTATPEQAALAERLNAIFRDAPPGFIEQARASMSQPTSLQQAAARDRVAAESHMEVSRLDQNRAVRDELLQRGMHPRVIGALSRQAARTVLDQVRENDERRGLSSVAAASSDQPVSDRLEMARRVAQSPSPAERSTNGRAEALPITDVNARVPPFNRTLLMTTRDPEVARSLIDAGADVNARDQYGHTPLMRNPIPAITEMLINAGAVVDARDNNNRPVIMQPLTPGVIGILINSGSDVNARDNDRQTPLMRHYDPAIARMLIAAGADVNAQDNRGHTALSIPRLAGYIGVLLDAGADVELRNIDGRTAISLASNVDAVRALINAGANVNTRDEQGRTPLAIHTNPEIIRLLLAAGADPAIEDNDGHTAEAHHSNQEIVAMLNGASSPARSALMEPRGGNTGVLLGNSDTNTTLVSNYDIVDGRIVPRHTIVTRYNVNDATSDGTTRLMIARDADEARRLIALGANVNARDGHERTPLMHQRNLEIIRLLLAAGADPVIEDDRGHNAEEHHSDQDIIAMLNEASQPMIPLSPEQEQLATSGFNRQMVSRMTPQEVTQELENLRRTAEQARVRLVTRHRIDAAMVSRMTDRRVMETITHLETE